MVTWALGLSMKKAGMRDPVDVFSQKCREGCRYVGGGGWKSNELMASPMFTISQYVLKTPELAAYHREQPNNA